MAVAQLAFCIGQFIQPFLIGELVDLIAQGPGNGLRDGLWIACGLGAASLFCSVCIAAAFLNNRMLGLGVRAATMMAVYQVCSAIRLGSLIEREYTCSAIHYAPKMVSFRQQPPIIPTNLIRRNIPNIVTSTRWVSRRARGSARRWAPPQT